MDALDAIHDGVIDEAIPCDILRKSSDGAYGGNFSPTGDTIDVAIFSPSSSGEVVTEGTGEETSMTGLALPQYDTNDNLIEVVQVGDRLQPTTATAKKYEVRVKEGHPNEVDPSMWRFGLDHANSSE